MSLRTRILSITGAIGVICLVLLLSFSSSLLMRSFATMDDREARESMRLFLNVIRSEQRHMQTLVGDWAPWDDTYEFAEDLGAEYISENLSLPTLQNIRADLFVIVSPQRDIRYSIMMESTRNRLRPLTSREERDLREYVSFISARDADFRSSGFLAIGGEAFFFASQAILNSNLQGPFRGTLVLGRRVSAERDTMAAITGLQADVLPPGKDGPNFDDTRLVRRKNGVIDATHTLSDPLGRPALLLSVHVPMRFSSDGMQTILILAAGILLTVLLAALSGVFLLLRFVSSPVQRLRELFERLELDARVDARIDAAEGEELDALSRSVNALLDTMETIFRNGPVPMLLTDAKGHIVEVNIAAERMLGRDRMVLRGATLSSYLSKSTARNMKNITEKTTISGSLIRSNGAELPVEIQIAPFEAGTRPISMITVRDLTEQIGMEQQLARMTYTDALTGLPNRAIFIEELEASLAIPDSARKSLAVLVLDIDRFKSLNEIVGPKAADAALRQMSARLRSILAPSDVLARWGGDEFAILARSLSGGTDLEVFLQKIKAVIETPSALGDYTTVPSASMGVVWDLSRYRDAGSVLGDVDFALARAQAEGTGHTVVFDPKQFGKRVNPLTFEDEILRAIEAQHLVAHYQPIVDLETMKIAGFETLARWKHPERGVILPAEFIPVAEETGLIDRIDRIMLIDACMQLTRWRALPGGADIFVSVNIAASEFLREDFAEKTIGAVTALGAPPDGIVLEITENTLLHDMDATAAIMERLKKAGLRVALDDFGAGYSSLRYLNRLPVGLVKIDRTFIRALPDSTSDTGVIRAVISISRNLNMDSLAEGIETTQQLLWLRESGCRYGQGFLFSHAVEPSAAAAFVGRTLTTPSQA